MLMDRVVLDVEREAELARAGYASLVDGETGPLLLAGQAEGGQQYRLLIRPERSTLPYRLALPVLIANLAGLTRAARVL